MRGKLTKMWQLKPKNRLVIVLSVASVISHSGLLLAQSNQPTNSHSPNIDISFNPSAELEPPDRGTPQSDEGTGSRGDCLDKPSLPSPISLVGKNHLQLTVSDRPTFWVYLPYTQAEASYGEFSLQHQDHEIYRTRFHLPDQPGIVSVSLPPTVPSLEMDKKYRWYVDINCSASAVVDDFSTPASVTGIVQRVALANSLAGELKTASKPLNQIATYAQHGIWYDAIAQLAQLRLEQPHNPTFEQTWNKLLSDRHVNLTEISSEPILGGVKTIKLENWQSKEYP